MKISTNAKNGVIGSFKDYQSPDSCSDNRHIGYSLCRRLESRNFRLVACRSSLASYKCGGSARSRKQALKKKQKKR